MKSIGLCLLTLATLLSFISCSRMPEYTSPGTINTMTANIPNPRERIHLGDTVMVKLLLPDTLSTSEGRKYIEVLNEGFIGLHIVHLDTSNGAFSLVDRAHFWTTRGSVSGNNQGQLDLSNDSRPYGVELYFKPPAKGVYYFDLSFEGQLKFNQDITMQMPVVFDAPDENLHLITSFARPDFLSIMQTRVNDVYFFKVE